MLHKSQIYNLDIFMTSFPNCRFYKKSTLQQVINRFFDASSSPAEKCLIYS